MRIQHVTAALGSLAAAAALALPTAAPADASARAAVACPEGFVCFWPEPGFGGEMRIVQDPQRDCETAPFQPARSVYNHSYDTRTFYAGTRCTVRVGALEPDGSARSVSVSSWH